MKSVGPVLAKKQSGNFGAGERLPCYPQFGITSNRIGEWRGLGNKTQMRNNHLNPVEVGAETCRWYDEVSSPGVMNVVELPQLQIEFK